MSHQQFDEGSVKKYTLTAILSFVILFCFLMLMMQCHGDYTIGGEEIAEKPVVTIEDGAAIPEPVAATPAENPDATKVSLPGGIAIDALKGGIEDKLVAFLNNPNTKGGKDAWFDFNNINFNTNSTELTTESSSQLQNIVAILKAYPTLKIKIGGYTDKVGDSIGNIKLSQARAEAVLNSLKLMSANPDQLVGAEGYGSQYAKAAADAPDEARKADRRMALSVREK